MKREKILRGRRNGREARDLERNSVVPSTHVERLTTASDSSSRSLILSHKHPHRQRTNAYRIKYILGFFSKKRKYFFKEEMFPSQCVMECSMQVSANLVRNLTHYTPLSP